MRLFSAMEGGVIVSVLSFVFPFLYNIQEVLSVRMSSLWINEQGSNHGPNVLDQLSFEHLDEDIHRSTGNLWIPWNSGRSIFGGQLIGLTINDSNSTISQNIFQLFSFNCHFYYQVIKKGKFISTLNEFVMDKIMQLD